MKQVLFTIIATLFIISCGSHKTEERIKPVDSVVTSILKDKMQEYDATSGIVIIKSVKTDNVSVIS